MNVFKVSFLAVALNLILFSTAFANFARVQVIHNSADVAAEVVDIWLNETLLLKDFKFRQATPFIDAPAGVPLTISIQPPNSKDTVGALAKFTYTLEQGKKYIIIANGIVIPMGYNPVKPFNLYVYDMARESASSPDNIDVLAFHGSTDAPTVDVVESLLGAGTIIDNFKYGEFRGYLELPNENYKLDIKDETGSATVISYSAPVKDLGLKGSSLVLMASGFLDPSKNNNGKDFGLFAVLTDGTVVGLPVVVTNVLEKNTNNTKVSNYPNPFSDYTYINFDVDKTTKVTINIYDNLGSIVTTLVDQTLTAGEYNFRFSADNLPNGVYTYKIIKGNEIITGKMNIVK